MTLETFNHLQSQAQKNRFDTPNIRIEKLKTLRNWIQNHDTEILKALYSDFKKPYFETDVSEVMIILSELKYFISHLSELMQDKAVATPLTLAGHSSHIRYENKGVVLIISPWNYPFQLTLAPLIAALAAGNTVVLKPSEFTPHTSTLLEKMIQDVFSGQKEVVLEIGGKEKTEDLLTYDFNHVFFTGSTAVGRIIAEKCATRLIPTTLELGGKSPLIIDESANITQAAEMLYWGKFLNAGQTCVAPDYVLVHANIYDAFKQKFKEHVQKLKTAPRAQIISPRHQARLEKILGHSLSTSEIELIDIENADHALMQEELFGPFSPILKFSSIEEITAVIQKNPDPLALYIFSNNQERIERILKENPSGGVAINTVLVHLGNHFLPFGGRGQSGWGKYHGQYGFYEFSHARAIIKQNGFYFLSRFVHPPYTDKKSKLLSWLKKIVS